jgi:hypothetical protein
VLAVTLDVGTDNETLLNDDDYMGIQEPRLDGDEYYDLVDEFMQAVTGRWPDVVGEQAFPVDTPSILAVYP